MTRILAIEPSPERGLLLRRLVREAVRAEVTVVTSTQQAIAATDTRPPDLILTSSLITPNDERDLVTHLRQTPALRHLPVLMMPAVVEETPEPEPQGLFSRLRRRRTAPLMPSYDFSAIATRIEEAISQSAIAKAANEGEVPVMIDPPPAEQVEALHASPLCQDVFTMRERAMRWASWQLPWFSKIQVPWGANLRLINLSSSGLLFESCARIPSGAATSLRLFGPDRDVIVPGRIVRSEVASVDRVGVMYQAAVAFDYAFDTMMPGTTEPAADVETHLAELVDLVHEKATQGALPEALRSDFEAGVMELVSKGEVRLRDVPVVENDGRESVYFTIATSDESAVLQVTFDPDYQPRPEEFEALKAAAIAASKVVTLIDTAQEVAVTTETTHTLVSVPLRLVLHVPESAPGLRQTA